MTVGSFLKGGSLLNIVAEVARTGKRNRKRCDGEGFSNAEESKSPMPSQRVYQNFRGFGEVSNKYIFEHLWCI
jgi:hypothetical protein